MCQVGWTEAGQWEVAAVRHKGDDKDSEGLLMFVCDVFSYRPLYDCNISMP